jgi:hypothetical protein
MPNWLWRSVVGTSLAIVVLSVAQWGACRFYVLPKVWPWYARYVGTPQGKAIDPAPMGCNDTDARTITVMMGVLTTLISLSRKAE